MITKREKVIIADVNENNFKDIPKMGKFDCQECMWFQKEKRSAERKENFLSELSKNHGSCAKIIYIGGRPAGYCHYCPKKYLIRLEDYKRGSINTDAWFIACLAVKKEYRSKGIALLMLKSVIKDLKERGIKKLQARGLTDGSGYNKGDNFPSGYWSIYEKLGFKEIGCVDNVKVGELTL